MKTIKQIADELGVSKQAVRKQVDKLPPTLISTGINNAILINDDGVKIIFKNMSTKNTRVDTNKVPTVDTLVDMLQNELDSKNAQIESQSRQLEAAQQTIKEQAQSIQELTATIGRQQALHAGTLHNQKQLTGFSLEYTEESAKGDSPQKETPTAPMGAVKPTFIERLKQFFK